MKKTMVALLAGAMLMMGSMVGGANATTISGSYGAVDNPGATNDLAGLNYTIIVNGDGTVTFDLKPILSTVDNRLKALTVGIVNQAGTFSQDLTFGSSDGTPPVDELVSSNGGITYNYTGSLPTGALGVFFIVNERDSNNGSDLQRFMGDTAMTRPNDWGGFDWSWNNRIDFENTAVAPVPEPGTMMLLGIGMGGLALFGKRRMNKEA